MLLVMLSAIITFAVLLFLIAYILINGIPHIKPELFALKYTSENGSLFPALINTIIMTALSLIIAVPFEISLQFFLWNMPNEEINLSMLSVLRRRHCLEFHRLYMDFLECCFLLQH